MNAFLARAVPDGELGAASKPCHGIIWSMQGYIAARLYNELMDRTAYLTDRRRLNIRFHEHHVVHSDTSETLAGAVECQGRGILEADQRDRPGRGGFWGCLDIEAEPTFNFVQIQPKSDWQQSGCQRHERTLIHASQSTRIYHASRCIVQGALGFH